MVILCTIPKAKDTVANDEGEDPVFTPEDFASSPTKVKDRIDWLVQRNVSLTTRNLRKIQIPIPFDEDAASANRARIFALQHADELISMSDGQIWLVDDELESSINDMSPGGGGGGGMSRRPCMDLQRSVTRIGIGADTESRADAAAIRRVVEGLRLELSQALLLLQDVRQSRASDGAASGSSSGSSSNSRSTKASKNQELQALGWLLAMHQPSTVGARKLSESCTALLAASKGYLGQVGGVVDARVLAGTVAGDDLMAGLLKHVQLNAAKAVEAIDSTQDMTEECREAIEGAIVSYFNSNTSSTGN